MICGSPAWRTNGSSRLPCAESTAIVSVAKKATAPGPRASHSASQSTSTHTKRIVQRRRDGDGQHMWTEAYLETAGIEVRGERLELVRAIPNLTKRDLGGHVHVEEIVVAIVDSCRLATESAKGAAEAGEKRQEAPVHEEFCGRQWAATRRERLEPDAGAQTDEAQYDPRHRHQKDNGRMHSRAVTVFATDHAQM